MQVSARLEVAHLLFARLVRAWAVGPAGVVIADLAALLCCDRRGRFNICPASRDLCSGYNRRAGPRRSALQRARRAHIMNRLSRSPAFVSAGASRRCRCRAPVFATSASRYIVDPLGAVKIGLEYPPYREWREGPN